MNDYDVIVIGSGIGGLTAAALLAKAGKAVLVLESHDRAGGYAHGFKRKKYRFDAGVHLISGCGTKGYRGGQVISKILRAVDAEHALRFVSIDPFSHVYFPDLEAALPQSIEAFVDRLGQLFPDQREGLAALTRLCIEVSEQITLADETMADLNHERAKQLLPALFEYRKATLAQVARKFIDDPKLLALFAGNWPYLGLPPSKVSFIYWSSMLTGYMVDGAYYCKGSFQQLADTLVATIEQHGGEIRFKTEAENIPIERGCVVGAASKDQRYSAPVVISNADLRHTVCKMVGEEYFPPGYLKRIEGMQHSLSIFVVYIATDIDLAAANLNHESFCYRDFDHERNYARTCNGEVSWISITAPTLVDPELAPPGQHLLMLTTLLPYTAAESWQKAKDAYIDAMLGIAEHYIPGLRKHILYIEGGSPATMERYTKNYQGAAYGWALTPDQIGPARLSNRTPIEGLYLAGHWTRPGGGIYGVSVSGVQAAKKVLGIKTQTEFWRYFGL